MRTQKAARLRRTSGNKSQTGKKKGEEKRQGPRDLEDSLTTKRVKRPRKRLTWQRKRAENPRKTQEKCPPEHLKRAKPFWIIWIKRATENANLSHNKKTWGTDPGTDRGTRQTEGRPRKTKKERKAPRKKSEQTNLTTQKRAIKRRKTRLVKGGDKPGLGKPF